MARTTYDSERQRQRRLTILATTRELLGKVGYDGTTIRGVAEAAGVDKATIYNHFESKDGLVLAALTGLLDQIEADVADDDFQSGFETLLARNEASCDQIERTPAYADAMSRALFRAGQDGALIDALVRRPVKSTRSLLEVEKQRGSLLDSIDCEALARRLESQRWGAILLWVLSVLPIAELRVTIRESLIATLASVATPRARRVLNKLRDAS